jgi:hypothetical protein
MKKTTKKTEKESLKRFDVYLTVYYDGHEGEEKKQKLNWGKRAFYFEAYDKDKDKLFLERLIKFLEEEKKTPAKYWDKYVNGSCRGIKKALEDSKKFTTIKSLKAGIENLYIEIREFDIEKEKKEIIDRKRGIENLSHLIENLENIKKKMRIEISKLIDESKESKETHDKLISEILVAQKELSAVDAVIENSYEILDEEKNVLYEIEELSNNLE